MHASLIDGNGNNVLDATMAWSKQVTDVTVLTGIPEMSLKGAAELASRRDLEGYVLTLDAPCYISVMTNADNRELRREVYEAYVTRASDQSTASADWDNKNVIDAILSGRAELARLLGYLSPAKLAA